MDNQEIITAILAQRKQSNNGWYSITLKDLQGRTVALKGFNTWLQTFAIDGIEKTKSSTPRDVKLKDFKQFIERALIDV